MLKFLNKQSTGKVISRPSVKTTKTTKQTTVLQHFTRQSECIQENTSIHHTRKPTNAIRLYSQNIGGIAPKTPQKFLSVTDTITDLQVDIACLQEINDTMPGDHRRKSMRGFAKGENRAKISVATLRPYNHHTSHQPGGNMVVLRSQLSRKRTDEGDEHRMGRWAVLSMKTPNKEVAASGMIRVVSAYRANAVDSGDNSTLNQQRKVLLQKGRSMSPQKAFETDLEKQLSTYHSKGTGSSWQETSTAL